MEGLGRLDHLDGTGDVYAFPDRLTSVAGAEDTQVDPDQPSDARYLKGVAHSRFLCELSDITKRALNTNASISQSMVSDPH